MRPLTFGCLCLLVTGCSVSEPGSDAGADAGVDAGSSIPDAGSFDAGPPLWPVGASRVEATLRGGFPAAICFVDGGTIDGETYVLTLADGRLEAVACTLVPPYPNTVLKTGTVVLDGGQLARFDDSMRTLTRSPRTFCGADAPSIALALTTAAGTVHYVDDFYACQPNDEFTTYVPELGVVLGLFREFAALQ
jgi:hypothetical protein